jgi:hypothetical protein
MRKTIFSLLLTGVAILPLNAYAQTLVTNTTTASNSAQNLSQDQLNAIKAGAVTNNGQQIPVETQIMMSTGNLDGYTIRKVQQSLSERGYYKGQATGNWDNETSTALQSFQRASGDHVDESGRLISSGTLARLGVTMDKLTAGDGAVPGNARTEASTTKNMHISTNANASYNPYHSPTVKSLGTVQTAANRDKPVGSYVGHSKVSAPGQTVEAPDNGTKATMTRDAVASGRFNRTIDGSVAHGTTDGTAIQSGATPNNTIAGTRSTTPVNNNNTANAPVVGSSRLTAGSTSSANVQTTGSLQDSAAPQVSGGSRYGNGTLESDNSTALSNAGIAPAAGGTSASGSSAASGNTSASGGSLSNSTSLSVTGSSSGIANSGGSLSGGSSAGAARGDLAGGSSSSSAGSGSLSGSGGGGGGGGL